MQRFISSGNRQITLYIPFSCSSRRTLNILLLGETGVGKSTFVNGCVCYLRYNSLDDALQAPAAADDDLVATSFTVRDDDDVEHRVTYGSDRNEVTAVGQSSTQLPRTYTCIAGSELKVVM